MERPTCDSCPYADRDAWRCRRHAPTFGFPEINANFWCGDHPKMVEMEQVATQAPMAKFFAAKVDEFLTRIGH